MKSNRFKKILASAIALMTLSTASAVSGTVAWFVASSEVTVQGFNMQAEVENGIVIANETHTADSHWLTTVDASHNGTAGSPATQQAFVATSTADCSSWYHATSASADDHTHSGAYTTLSVTKPTEISGNGIGTTTSLTTSGTKNVYLLNSFYIQAAAQSTIDAQDIYLTNLTVSGNTSSQELDKSLRLAVVYNSTTTIFGVVDGFTATYGVNGAAAVTNIAKNASVNNKVDIATNVSIPVYTPDGTNALKFDIYLYFEGEDAACKSSNIKATLDTLSISFKFGNEAHA